MTPADDAPRCRATGCLKPRRASQIFCAKHWYTLPRETRDAIWQAYRAQDTRRSVVLIRDAVHWLASHAAQPSERAARD